MTNEGGKTVSSSSYPVYLVALWVCLISVVPPSPVYATSGLGYVPIPSDHLPDLVKDLESDDPGRNLAAARQINLAGWFGLPPNSPCFAPLLRALHDVLKRPNLTAEEQLAVATALHNTTRQLGRSTKLALSTFFQSEVVPTLTMLLASPHRSTQIAAASALGSLGETSAPAVPQLIEIIRTMDPIDPRLPEALGGIGPAAKGAVPVLIDLVRYRDTWVQYATVRAFAYVRDTRPQVIHALVEAVQHSPPRVAEEAVLSLAMLGPDAHKAVPFLLDFVQQEHPVRIISFAAQALGEIASAESEVRAVLIHLLSHPNHQVREGAAAALRKVKAPAPKVEDALLRVFLTDPSPSARFSAANALAATGTRSDRVVEAFLHALSTEDFPVTKADLLWRVAWVGADSPEAFAYVRRSVADASGSSKAQAIKALGFFRSHPGQVQALLTEAEKDPNDVIRAAAIESWARFPFSSEVVNPKFLRALNDPSWKVRNEALRAIMTGTELRMEALPHLISLLKDGHFSDIPGAEELLEQIGTVQAREVLAEIRAQRRCSIIASGKTEQSADQEEMASSSK